MASDLRMALIELLRKADLEQDTDVLREGVRVLSQALMELEVSQHVNAERCEHTVERTGQRNGCRERQNQAQSLCLRSSISMTTYTSEHPVLAP